MISYDFVQRLFFLWVIFVGKNNGKQNDTKMFVSHKHFRVSDSACEKGREGFMEWSMSGIRRKRWWLHRQDLSKS